MDVLTAQLFRNMTAYDAGDPARIQHFTKVYAYADLIGTSEGLTEISAFIKARRNTVMTMENIRSSRDLPKPGSSFPGSKVTQKTRSGASSI